MDIGQRPRRDPASATSPLKRASATLDRRPGARAAAPTSDAASSQQATFRLGSKGQRILQTPAVPDGLGHLGRGGSATVEAIPPGQFLHPHKRDLARQEPYSAVLATQSLRKPYIDPRWGSALPIPADHAANIELFETPEAHLKQARQEVVRRALQAIQQAAPQLSSSLWIDAAATVAETFFHDYKYVSPRLPLSTRDVMVIERAARALCERVMGTGGVNLPPGGGGSLQLAPAAGTVPPSLEANSRWAPQSTMVQEALAQFHTVEDRAKDRFERYFARYDPGRMHQVPDILRHIAGLGYAGAEEDVIKQLVSQYGPEPGPASVEYCAALAAPLIARDGRLTIHATIRRPKNYPVYWTLIRGNEYASSPAPLDPFRSLGLVKEQCLHSAPVGDAAVEETWAMEFAPGVLQMRCQYTISVSSKQSSDSRVIFVEPSS